MEGLRSGHRRSRSPHAGEPGAHWLPQRDDRGRIGIRVGREGFVPLANVPDYVWIHNAARPSENIQHFADIDIVDIGGGPSMLQSCIDDPANIAASKWKAYLDGSAEKGAGPEESALRFRVWQIWDAMVVPETRRRASLRGGRRRHGTLCRRRVAAAALFLHASRNSADAKTERAKLPVAAQQPGRATRPPKSGA
jgi:hypothetical protein